MALALPGHAALAEAGPALPSGGAVVGGQAQILAPANGQLLIDQQTARAVIDWRSFSIGEGGHVHFRNGSGATLNRVLGGDPSRIAGLLSATGSVWLVNPAGVLVAPDGTVTTGGSFVASTRSIAPAAFMAGGGLLEGSSTAALENDGRIEAGGDIVLIGRLVENRGSLKAGADARLVSADRILLHEAGADGRVHVELAPDSGAGGAVRNSGRIEAAAAELRAVGGNVYALAADTGGLIRATGVARQGGRILLVGDEGVTVTGTLDASGIAGGAIDVTGSGIAVQDGARILASGSSGDGGTIRVGGALKGGPGLAPANRLLVEDGAEIDVSSRSGRGGTAILWSEEWTRFEGLIRADGGLGGGFVETSSKGALGIENGRVEVGNGDWLLDPRNVTIGVGGFNPGGPYPNPFEIAPPDAAGAFVVSRSALQDALNLGSDVTVTTEQPARTDAGDIAVSATVSWTGAGSLTLRADNNIAVNSAISSTGTGSLTLLAGVTNPAGSITTTSTLTMARGTINMTAPGSITIGQTVSLSNAAALSATAGAGINVNGAINAAAGSSGSVLLDAGTTLTLNTAFNLQGSTSFRGVSRGAGNAILFGGSGNRAFLTGSGSLTLETTNSAGDMVIGRNSSAAGNFRIGTGAGGSLTLRSARDILLVSSDFGSGRWTRVGVAGVNAAVTLDAARNVTFDVGSFSDNFVEVVSGGAISVTAGARLDMISSSLSQARIQGSGPSYTLSAPVGVLNGGISSTGDTLITGGAFSIGTTSPVFTLASGRSFTLAAGSSITSSSALSITTSGTGDIRFDGPVNGTTLVANAGDELAFSRPIAMSGSGSALTLAAGRRLVNEAGIAPLSAPNGRWLTYSVSPFDDIGWQELNPDAPNLYGRTFGFLPPVSSPGTGNRRIYSFVPVLSLTGDSASKIYGQSGPALGFTVSGLVPGDTLAMALVGGTATVTSSGTAPTAPVGSYATNVAATATAQGYQLDLVPGTLLVDPAPLTVVADAQTRQYGLADPGLTFSASGFVNGESTSVLTGGLVRAAGENVGVYAIGRGTLAAANYTISFAGADFTITRAPLTVVANQQTREYGLADPALTFTATGFRLGDTAATALTGGLARAPGETVGLYAIGQGTLAAQNYDIGFTPANLTITPAPLGVNALPGSKTYGEADPVLAFTAVGFRLGDTAASLTGALSRTPGENVGIYDITLGTLSNPNYAISFGAASFTINPATLQVSALAQTREYGLVDPVLSFSAVGFVNGDTVATALTGSLARAAGENVGIYAIGQGTLAAANYTISFAGADFTISRAPLGVVATPATREYGLADPALGFTATGFRLGDTAATALTGGLSRTAGEDVGLYTIGQGSLAAQNYAISFTAADFTITPAPLGVTALPGSKTYGAPDTAFAFTATGFRLGDTAASLTGALSRTAGENVGAYDITLGTLGNPNYAISFVGARFTIDPATLQVVANAQTREYGLADPALTFSAIGFVNGDTASVLTGALARAPGETVGLYAIGQGTLAAANYLIDFTGADFTITPAPLRITPQNVSVNAADLPPDPAIPFAATGFRLGDTAATALTGALTRVGAGTAAPGDYAILPGTLASTGNYVLSFDPAIFSVTQLVLNVIALDQRRLYGAADPQFTFTVSGFAPGDDESILTGSLVRAAGETVGSYAITQGSLSAVGYTISFTPGTLTIDPAPLRVTALDFTREYGLADPLRWAFSATGFVLGEDESVLTGALARVAGENVGTYAIQQGSLAAANYSINFTPGALTITPAPLSVVADDSSRVYGDVDPSILTFDVTGFRLGDGPSILSGALVRDPGNDAGLYAIRQGTLSAGGNYAIAFTNGTFEILRAGLQITADQLRRLYGDVDPALSFTTSGLVAGDTAASALTGALTRDPGENVGAYAITQGSLASRNYTISFTPGALTIDPAPLSVVAEPGRKTYGRPDPTLTFTASGFRLGDTLASLSGSLARDSGETVGAYAITQGTLANPNYSISFSGGIFTIDPATLRVVATAATKVYGDADPALGFVATGFQFADTAQTVITGTLQRTPGETVAGSPYPIGPGTLSAGPNYVIAFESAPFTISRRLLTLAVVGGVSRTYDATVTATLGSANLQLGGVLPGDAVAATAASAAFDTPDVGTGKLVTASGVTLTGAAAGNYAVAPTASGAIGTITPAPLVATALDAERPFGVQNPPLGLSLSGLLGSDTAQSIGLTAVTDANRVSPPGAYAINVAGTPRNYSVTRMSGILTVLPIPGLVQFVPELIEVPALGGYIQQGVGAGVTSISNTLLAERPIRQQEMVRASRFTVSLQPASPTGDTPAGASVFETAGLSR